MAKAELTIRIADIKRFRLFVWELRQLAEEMVVMASPHADRLDHATGAARLKSPTFENDIALKITAR